MHRKNEKVRNLAFAVLAAALAVPAAEVHAEESAEVFMKPGAYTEKSRTLEVDCVLENGTNITNGKIRILYDGDKASLKGIEKGNALDGAMAEINDCLTGNKEEGEIVEAFASADNISPDGTLLEMELQLADHVKTGDKINFEVNVETLAGDSGDVAAQTEAYVFTVGSENTGAGGNTDSSDNSKGENEVSDSSKGENEVSDNAKEEKDKNPEKSVKTGDNSNIYPYILVCGAAAAVAGGCAWKIQKRKSK